ncbi:MAG: hypothetical protein ACPL1Y_01465 [Thermoplasmata archaeon]
MPRAHSQFGERAAELEREIEKLRNKLANLDLERETLIKELENARRQYQHYEKLLREMRKELRPFTMKELLLRI